MKGESRTSKAKIKRKGRKNCPKASLQRLKSTEGEGNPRGSALIKELQLLKSLEFSTPRGKGRALRAIGNLRLRLLATTNAAARRGWMLSKVHQKDAKVHDIAGKRSHEFKIKIFHFYFYFFYFLFFPFEGAEYELFTSGSASTLQKAAHTHRTEPSNSRI